MLVSFDPIGDWTGFDGESVTESHQNTAYHPSFRHPVTHNASSNEQLDDFFTLLFLRTTVITAA